MKTIHKILLYIEKNKINIYNIRDKQFEIISRDGEEDISFGEDFWEWFRGALSYSKEYDLIDYCVLTDNSMDINFNNFNIVETSSWKDYEIGKFYDEFIHKSTITLKDRQGKIVLSLKKPIQLFEKNERIEYEIVTIGDLFSKNNNTSENEISNDDLRNYYLKKMSSGEKI